MPQPEYSPPLATEAPDASRSPSREPLLTQRDVAALLRTSPKALERWRQEGLGPKYLQINPRCIRYRRSEVMAWLQERERTSTKEAGEESANGSASSRSP